VGSSSAPLKHAAGSGLRLRHRGRRNEEIERDVVVVVVEEEVERSGYCMFVGCLLGASFLVGRGRRGVEGRDRYYSILLADAIQDQREMKERRTYDSSLMASSLLSYTKALHASLNLPTIFARSL
jgi:hypothetical protein